MGRSLLIFSVLCLYLLQMPCLRAQDIRCIYSAGNDYRSAGTVTPTGEFVFTGTNRGTTGNDYKKVVLVKTGKDGKVLWHKLFQLAGHATGEHIAIAPDGDYIVGGHISEDGVWHNQRLDPIVVRFDTAGSLKWALTLKLEHAQYLNSLCISPDGSIYVYASTTTDTTSPNLTTMVVKLDSDGSILWQKPYISSLTTGEAVATRDGGLLIHNSKSILKLDANGKVEWIKGYNRLRSQYSCPPIQLQDGGYLFALSQYQVIPEFELVKLSPQGEVVWQSRVYNFSYIFGLQEAPDGDLVVAGKAVPGDFVPEQHMAIYRFSGNGELLHGGMYTDTGIYQSMYSSPNTISLCPDGRFFLFGFMGPPESVEFWYPYLVMTTAQPFSGCITPLDTNSGPAPEITSQNGTIASEPGITFTPDFLFSHPAQYNTVRIVLCESCIPPQAQLGPDTALCGNTSLLLKLKNTSGTITWSDGSSGDSLLVNEAGTYWVRVENSCGTATDTITIYRSSPPVLSVDISHLEAWPGDTITFIDRTPGIKQRLWRFGDGDSSSTMIVRHAYKKNGRYTVTLNVADSLGCTANASFDIFISGYSLYVPDAFTPGNDTLNNVFEPVGVGIANYRLLVFNRWGEIIYEGKDRGWDGTFRERRVIEGIYHYMLTVQYDYGKFETRQGRIVLLRP